MNLTATHRLCSLVLLGLTCWLTLGGTVSGGPAARMAGTPSITVLFNRDNPDKGASTDLNALVGGSSSDGLNAGRITCSGAFSMTVAWSHTDPRFGYEIPPAVECGSTYFWHGGFTPTEPGLVTDQLTFSTTLGTVTKQILGNGVIPMQADASNSWTLDFGANTLTIDLVYDGKRDLVYIAEYNFNQILVVSPSTHSLLKAISVGKQPMGMALTPDRDRLYVANSGELSISAVDLVAQTQAYTIAVPSLGPGSFYTPSDIAVVSPTLALVGSRPQGAGSGGPIHQLDLLSRAVLPRPDIGAGMYPLLRTSRDYVATAILVEPGSSPTVVALYDPQSNTAIQAGGNIDGALGISADGKRLSIAFHDCNGGYPDLTIRNEQLLRLGMIQLLGCQTVATAFSPLTARFVYGLDGRAPDLHEARLDQMRETRDWSYAVPGYGPIVYPLSLSDDGVWAYFLLTSVWNWPVQSSKLMAIRVGPPPDPRPLDETPPSSSLKPLAPTQAHNWWTVSWTGTDDLSGIDHYEVQYRLGVDGLWTDWLSSTSAQALFVDATAGQTYYFRIRAVDRDGNVELYPNDFQTYTSAGSDPSGLSRVYLPLIRR